VQGIPAGGLVGVDGRAVGNPAGDHRHALVLGPDHERQRAALALAHDHHDPALAGLVLGQTTVDPVGLEIGRLAMAAEVGTIDLDMALGLVLWDCPGLVDG
jgi:hypothetical protein